MVKNIIINADDFGLKPSVNKAITELFKSGLINSTTIMANMPGFDEAVELAFKNNFVDRIGIHLTLSGGLPLTQKILDSKLFYTGNEFDLKKYKRRLFLLSEDAKQLTYNELAAQIERVRRAGIPISHIDTHHHLDEVWSITLMLLELLKVYNIPSMRILNNLNRSSKFYKTCYRKIVNKYISFRKSNFSDFFGNLPESIQILRKSGSFNQLKRIEIMVHPDINNNGQIVNRINHQEFVFNYPEDIRKMLNN